MALSTEGGNDIYCPGVLQPGLVEHLDTNERVEFASLEVAGDEAVTEDLGEPRARDVVEFWNWYLLEDLCLFDNLDLQ